MSPLAHVQRTAGNQAVMRALAGAPLPRELRSSLETYFRTPLDRVRVHTDESSQSFADSLGASAFTVGQDIHLGSDGARATGSDRSELLAHEVVHTLQQGQVGPRAKLKVGDAGDRYERQAERMSQSFARGGVAEAVEPVSTPTIQCRRLRAHFGEFEDFIYRIRTHDATGDDVGVEMHLKFHPNANAAPASVIGLTQAVKNTAGGRTLNLGILGARQANRGAGVGWTLDRIAGQPNPLYAARETPKPGGDPARMQDYPTEPITALNPPEHGQRFTGWGSHGSAQVVGGTLNAVPAELYDATFHQPVLPNSSQVFETTALAVRGLNPAYLGSVEWGWETDAAGSMTTLPFRVLSQGVPTVNFLTAASIWNPSRADFAFETTAVVTLFEMRPKPGGGTDKIPVVDVPAGRRVSPTGNSGRLGAVQFIEVDFGGDVGYADAANLRPAVVGAETLDLPVPMIHEVTNPAGSTMIKNATGGTGAQNTLLLPKGTRVTTTRCMKPTATLSFHYEGVVVDGPHIGTRGFFHVPDLTLERVGTP